MLHKKLNFQANALGYQLGENGICYGIVCMALQAILVGDFVRFMQRINALSKIDNDKFAEIISSIYIQRVEDIKKINAMEISKEEKDKLLFLDDELRHLFEFQAFFDGIALYFKPDAYSELYNKDNIVVSQDCLSTSPFLLPQQLGEQKLTSTKKTGAYNQQDLIAYLECIEQSFDSDPAYAHPIPILLSDISHAILISYNPVIKKWLFIDPNYLPYLGIAQPQHLSELIMKAFNSEVVVMDSEIFATSNHSIEFNNKIDRLNSNQIWNEIHKPTKKNAKYITSTSASWLFLALEKNDTNLAKRLILQGADVNLSFKGLSPLYISILNNNLDLVNALIEAKADLNPSDDYSLLGLAIELGNVEIINTLIKAGININKRDKNNVSALDIAIKLQNIDAVKLLIKYKADINSQTQRASTPLIKACFSNNTRIAKLFLDAKADPNTKSTKGDTPLLIAASNNNLSLLNLLLKQHADPNIKNSHSLTPLFIAAKNGSEAIVESLLEHSANTEISSDFSKTALFNLFKTYATEDQKQKFITLFKMTENSFSDRISITPLQVALIMNRQDVFEYLFDAGADSQKTILGLDLYDVAKALDNKRAMKLLQRSVKRNKITKLGQSLYSSKHKPKLSKSAQNDFSFKVKK